MPLSVKKSNNIFIDSSIAFYCAANVGYRWAVKVMYLIAAGKIRGITDTFVCQEILERFFSSEEPGKGELLCSCFGQKMHRCFKEIVDRVLPVSVSDFDASYRLFKKHPAKSPRELLHAAVTMNHKVTKIFALDGPDYSDISTIQVLKLKNLLQALKLPGNYIYERTGQEG